MVRRVINKIFFKSRLDEYIDFLKLLRLREYTIYPLCDYVDKDGCFIDKYFIRIDVDKDPRAALAIGKAMQDYGRASFYFRWATMDTDIMRELKDMGYEVSLHYETLANIFREDKIKRKAEVTSEIIERGRKALFFEVQAFQDAFWEVKTITAHGQILNRKVGVTNDILNHPLDVTNINHDTDKFSLSYHRCTLIHPCKILITNKIERLISDLMDKR